MEVFKTKELQPRKFENLTLYLPMFVYFAFMIILLILRSYPIYWLTGNEYYNPVYASRGYNLVPFRTISFYIGEYRKAYLDVFGNVAIFVPMGVYYQLLDENRKVWKSLALLFCTILFIEISQYIFSTGAFDIDDIFLNSIGGIIGVATYCVIYSLSKRNGTNARDIVSMASMLVAPFLVFVVVQYTMWYHPIYYGVASFLGVTIWDVLLYRLYLDKELHIKKTYWIFAVILILMYLFLILPEVSPNNF